MWLIYALGGGWGHLTRACALARAHPARILTNSPYADRVSGDFDLARVATREDAVRAIRECAPARLIVDTFPRGLGGELAGELDAVAAPKVLVHRDLNPDYVTARDLTRFVAAHYQLVLAPGEGDAFPAYRTAPWLIRDAAELRPREGDYIYIAAAGRPEEAVWYSAVADGLRSSGVTVNEDRDWPAIDRIAGARAVIGGGGYNTVQECTATHTSLIARAWPRQYDRQAERLARCPVARAVETVEEAVAETVRLWFAPPVARRRPDYINGVHEAARLIAAL